MRFLIWVAVAAVGACAAPADAPTAETPRGAESKAQAGGPVDDGTYLARIDPLGGDGLFSASERKISPPSRP